VRVETEVRDIPPHFVEVISNMRNFIYILLILLMISVNSYACSCGETESVKKAFKRSEIVFVGTVISSQPFEVAKEKLGDEFIEIDNNIEVTFEVSEWFKGTPQTTQTIYTGVGDGDCGIYFQEGQQYIIYATNEGIYFELGSSKFQTNSCDRTNQLLELPNDLTELRKLR